MKKKKYGSIRIQMAVTFIMVIFTMGILIILANFLWLQKFYQKNKMNEVIKAYDQIELLFSEYDINSFEFELEFEKICTTNNLSVLVVDKSLDTIISSMNESSKQVAYRLYSYIFTGDPNFLFKDSYISEQEENNNLVDDIVDKKLLENNKYQIRVNTDPRMHNDYMELLGSIQEDYMLIMRTPVEGIRISAKVGNNYVVFVLLFMLAVGVVLVIFVTRRITKPILALANISEKMTMLDFTAKYEGNDRNEIGFLGEHMNELSKALEKNISELKSANNTLKTDLKQREELDKVRSEFVSNVSHELKTPIALVQGYAEGLKDIVRDDPQEVDYYCEVIIDEAAKMNRMVKNLIELNQLELGNDIHMERFDVAELIKNYISSSKLIIQQSEVKLIVKGEEKLYVWGDEFKIEEVFMNYFSNALHYVDENKAIEINIKKNGDKARIEVYNSGANIEEEECIHIWDKFYKIDKARSREYGGSGIGLSIVKAIMEAHHQKYGVENKNNGVSFYFELDCK